MYQTRAQVSKKIPIARKGTKYVARASSDPQNSVPVVIAVRDMLKLARITKEVKAMIHQKHLKINGNEVKDHRESIQLFNIFEADKPYILSLTPTGKFTLEETKQKERQCKVTNKKILKGKKIQLNFHDGSNILTDDKKINTQDTVYLSFDKKIKKHVQFEKGKECLITRGRFIGQKGKIEKIENNTAFVKISGKDGAETKLEKKGLIVL